MSIFIISIFACVFTFLGGLFALKFKDKLHLVMGFGAGAVLGVAFFDLIPESIELSEGFLTVNQAVSIVAVGFILYMLIDRLVISHNHKTGECHDCETDCHHEEGDESDKDAHVHTDEYSHDHKKGNLAALSLAIHSFLDGFSIGIAFQVSSAVGVIVTIAVLIHKFSDGLNTVNLILKNHGGKKQALRWLSVNSIAPILGVVATLFFTISQNILGVILGLFAGFFIYIAASNMIPESHHSHSTKWTTIMTLLGAVVLYVAIKISGI